MDKEETDETKNGTSFQVSSKCESLKKTMNDKCLVIGETKMYYGNFGSVHVMSPIPGSPNPGTEPEHAYIRPESPKEATMPLRVTLKDKPKKGKKKRKNKSTCGNKDVSPKYALPPLKTVPESKGNFTTREKKGREPCHFERSTYYKENDYSLGQADSWIPQPGFKSSGKKTTPKNTLISESSSLKYGSLLKLIESSKKVQASPSLETTAIESVRLPPIRGAQRRTDSAKSCNVPTVQFIKIYKDSDQLPPIKVSSMPMAYRNEQKEYDKVTKGYQW